MTETEEIAYLKEKIKTVDKMLSSVVIDVHLDTTRDRVMVKLLLPYANLPDVLQDKADFLLKNKNK